MRIFICRLPQEEEELDLYEILGLDEEASLKEIKKAYRKLSKEYHPDRNLDNKEDTTKKFQEVSMAYEVSSTFVTLAQVGSLTRLVVVVE